MSDYVKIVLKNKKTGEYVSDTNLGNGPIRYTCRRGDAGDYGCHDSKSEYAIRALRNFPDLRVVRVRKVPRKVVTGYVHPTCGGGPGRLVMLDEDMPQNARVEVRIAKPVKP